MGLEGKWDSRADPAAPPHPKRKSIFHFLLAFFNKGIHPHFWQLRKSDILVRPRPPFLISVKTLWLLILRFPFTNFSIGFENRWQCSVLKGRKLPKQLAWEYIIDFATIILPGRLKLKPIAFFVDFFTIVSTQLSMSWYSLLISMPRMIALSFISKPSSRISSGVGSKTPTGTRTVFSMLQHKPDSIPNLVRMLLMRVNVCRSIITRQEASSAIARVFELRQLTCAFCGRILGGRTPAGSQVPTICKSNKTTKFGNRGEKETD